MPPPRPGPARPGPARRPLPVPRGSALPHGTAPRPGPAMAHSAPLGLLEQGCPIQVEHDRKRRQFTVRLNGNGGGSGEQSPPRSHGSSPRCPQPPPPVPPGALLGTPQLLTAPPPGVPVPPHQSRGPHRFPARGAVWGSGHRQQLPQRSAEGALRCVLLTPPYGPATPFGRPSSVRKAPDPIPACRAAPFKQLKRKETIQKLCTRLEAFPRNPSSRMELFWTLFFFFSLNSNH